MGKRPPEYVSWYSMRSRCNNRKVDAYPRYGGRGITICERWSTFENFLADMGPRPSPQHSIERKDPNGNYEPSNCRWATKTEQANNRATNRMVEWNGKTMSLADACAGASVSCQTVRLRLARGWDLKRAIETPSNGMGNSKMLTFDGTTMLRSEWDKKLGFPPGTVSWRLGKGWSAEKALTTPSRSLP